LDIDAHPKRFPKGKFHYFYQFSKMVLFQEWALKLIEEVYTFKFNKDTKNIKLTKNVSNVSKDSNEEFPAVIFLYFLEKFKMRKLAEHVKK